MKCDVLILGGGAAGAEARGGNEGQEQHGQSLHHANIPAGN